MPTSRIPTYESIVAACKVGCFCCGALLDPSKVKPQNGTTKLNACYVVTCSVCGDPTMFAVRSPERR
jgi:RNase P subunit RPR2